MVKKNHIYPRIGFEAHVGHLITFNELAEPDIIQYHSKLGQYKNIKDLFGRMPYSNHFCWFIPVVNSNTFSVNRTRFNKMVHEIFTDPVIPEKEMIDLLIHHFEWEPNPKFKEIKL